jgi:hypothetical protein
LGWELNGVGLVDSSLSADHLRRLAFNDFIERCLLRAAPKADLHYLIGLFIRFLGENLSFPVGVFEFDRMDL